MTPERRNEPTGSLVSVEPPLDVGGVAPSVHTDHVRTGRLVGRNMLALVASQFVTTPISMVVNALMGRALGAVDFGAIYLATTILTTAFLVVEWGAYGQVAAAVARDRSVAPRLLGTGLVMRACLVVPMLALIPWFGRWMAYDDTVQLALLLCGIRLAITTFTLLCAAVVRGFEQIRWHAAANTASSVLEAALVASVLLAGGGLKGVLLAQIVSAGLAFTVQIVLIAKLGIWRLSVDLHTVKLLLAGGFSFVVLDLILRLQPYIDATLMKKLAEPEALGWHSAATRIQGVLLIPATTLSVALYPTLARLWVEDPDMCRRMVRLAFRAVILLGLLAATGTVIFAPFVVGIVYGRDGYGQAATNLSILSAYVLLVYASLVLAPFLLVVGRQWKYAIAQSLCLIVSLVLDPILIPWAQDAYGNGGIGVCISVVTAEVLMVAAGLGLMPKGVLDRSLARSFGRAFLGAAAMALAAAPLRTYPLLAMPAGVAVYVGLLWFQREIDHDLLSLSPERIADRLKFLERSRHV